MSNYDANLVGAITDKGLYRSQNEDAYWRPDHTTPVHLGALYLVADGVGGQEHGAIAARIVTAVLSEAFYRAREQGEAIPEALRFGIAQANQAVFDEAQLNGVRMGATVAAAVHHQGQLFVAHVGDSRAYVRHGQEFSLLTRDDSIVQQQLDAGVITPAEAAEHQFRNLVTQVLGNKLEIEIHLAEPRPFAENDVLLLCTDGLSGVITDAALAEILADQAAPDAAKALIAAAKEAGSQDNITAVVVTQVAQQIVPLVPTGVAAKPKKERSVWLWGVMLVFLFVVLGLLWWQRSQTPPESAADETAKEVIVLPTGVGPTPVSATPLSATPTPGSAAAADGGEAADPAAFSQADATETAGGGTVAPTITAAPSATPANMGCVDPNIQIVYVWTREDLTLETCAGAVAQQSLSSGEAFFLLEATPEALPAPGFCAEVDFIEIQAQVDETIAGWVLETQIL
ncbi:MAG: protein phosphatase 2C domain-containing protein, partial [Chloroflexota bacterium]